MRKHVGIIAGLCVVVVISFVVARGLTADEQSPPPTPQAVQPAAPTPEEVQARIAELIQQLGAEDFEKREAAQEALYEIGEPARKQLEEALKNTDQEIAYRATIILKDLSLANVTILITDKKGAPLAGKHVNIELTRNQQTNLEEPDSTPETVSVDDALSQDGTIALGMLTPDIYFVQIRVEGRCAQFINMRFDSGRRTCRFIAYAGGKVKGRLLDTEGKPLKADVTTYVSEDEISASTDENGDFLIEGVPEGVCYLSAQSGEAYFDIGDPAVTVVDGETSEVTLTATPQSDACGLRCKIVGPDGKMPDGVIYLIIPPKGWSNAGPHFEDRRYGQSGGEDFTEFPYLAAGKYAEMTIIAKGCAPCKLKDIEIRGDKMTDLPGKVKLEKGRKLKVRALDSEGKPLPGAFVAVVDVSKPRHLLNFSMSEGGGENGLDIVETGDNGEAEFDSLGDGTYAVRASSDTEGISDEMTADVKEGETATCEIDYRSRTALALTVVDAETGEAISTEGSPIIENNYRNTPRTEDEDGYVIFPGAEGMVEHKDKGRMLMAARKGEKILLLYEGYKQVVYVVDEMPKGKVTEATVRLEKLGAGDAKVTLAAGKGMPLTEVAEVYFHHSRPQQNSAVNEHLYFLAWDKKADAEGNGVFAAKDVPEGPCYVSVLNKDGRLIALYKTVIEKGKENEIAFTLPGAGAIEGTLTDADGDTIPSTEVALVPDKMMATYVAGVYPSPVQNMFLSTVTTDNDGKFAFDKVPEGNYLLYLQGIDTQTALPLIVKADETARADFRLGRPFDMTITLNLPEGETMPPSAYAGLTPATNSDARMATIFMEGYFYALNMENHPATIHGIRPGKYWLQITASGDQPDVLREVEITPETKNVDVGISLKPGRQKISGAVKNLHSHLPGMFDTGAVIARSDDLIVMQVLEPDGSFELRNLPPGKYRVCAVNLDELCVNRADCSPVKEVTVEEGRDVEGVSIP
jgi:hypothetical protein